MRSDLLHKSTIDHSEETSIERILAKVRRNNTIYDGIDHRHPPHEERDIETIEQIARNIQAKRALEFLQSNHTSVHEKKKRVDELEKAGILPGPRLTSSVYEALRIHDFWPGNYALWIGSSIIKYSLSFSYFSCRISLG